MNDFDDIDALMAEELDLKAEEIWKQGVREALGDEEFKRFYPEFAQDVTSDEEN